MKQKRFFVFLAGMYCLGVFLFLSVVHAASPTVVISEIGAYESTGQEWIEIVNIGESSIDLSGWTFWEDDTRHAIHIASSTSSTLASGAYAIIAQDRGQLLAAYPHFTVSVFDSSWGSLKESGEAIGLQNSAGEFVDQLTYIAAPDFSLQKKDVLSSDATASNWQEHATGNTLGLPNVFPAEVIPEELQPEDDIPEDPVPDVGDDNPQEEVSRTGQIRISEIVTQSAEGEWVEVWNAGTSTVDVWGWKLFDGVGDIAALDGAIPTGTYAVFPIQGSKLNNGGDIVQLFNASSTLVETLVYGAWEGAMVDAPTAEQSIAWDGDEFSLTNVVTPGAKNQIVLPDEGDDSSGGSGSSIPVPAQQEVLAGDIVINEFVSDPVDEQEEFIELYNTTNARIFLDGWYIEEGSESRTKLEGSIDAHAFFVIKKPKGSLNNSGDIMLLYDAADRNIDQVTYGSWDDGNIFDNAPVAKDPASVARKKDGRDSDTDQYDFVVTHTITAGAANSITAIQKNGEHDDISYGVLPDTMHIYEVFPNPEGSDSEDEFIELLNTGTETIDITGWKLGDASKKRYVIPDGHIESGAYAIFYRKQTGIALNNTGSEEVGLYGPNNELLETIRYSGASEGESYAKKESGEWAWTTAVTPGEKNSIEGRSAAPIIVIDVESTVATNEPILFDASDTTDPDGDDMTFVWSIDGMYEEFGDVVEYQFSEAGLYTITLTVEDVTGHIATSQVIIDVRPAYAFVGGNPESDPVEYVFISEFFPNPEGSDTAEFIELFNASEHRVELGGMKLDDEEGGSRAYTFPDGSGIAAQSYMVISKKDSKLALNNTSDAVRLLYPDGTILRDVPYDDAIEGASYVLDEESGVWVWTGTVTPGQGNIVSMRDAIKKKTTRTSSKHIKQTIDSTLTQVRQEDLGDRVHLTGIVTVLPGVLGSQYFYIGPNPGVQVYMYKKDFPTMVVGDVISVEGEVSEIAGETRIKLKDKEAIHILENQVPPAPLKTDIASVGESTEGSLIQVEGEITESKSSYLYIDDGTEEVKIYIKKGTGIERKVFQVGDVLQVTGVVSQSRSGFQLLPRSQADLKKIGIAEQEAVGVDGNTESDSDVAETYLTATAGGITSILVGLLAKVHGSSAMRFLRKGSGIAAAFIRRRQG